MDDNLFRPVDHLGLKLEGTQDRWGPGGLTDKVARICHGWANLLPVPAAAQAQVIANVARCRRDLMRYEADSAISLRRISASVYPDF